MKQRILIEEVTALSFAQQEILRSIWKPARYDIAVSRVCINAENDEYKWLEFAVGDIKVHRNGEIILNDLRLTDGFVKISEGEAYDDDHFELQEPTAFLKSETLPLLTIGQMMSMLYMLDKEIYHFYLLSGNEKYACEIGDFNSSLKPQLLKRHRKVDEIADVLWTTLKMIL